MVKSTQLKSHNFENILIRSNLLDSLLKRNLKRPKLIQKKKQKKFHQLMTNKFN